LNSSRPGRTKRASVLRAAQALRVAVAMSGRKCSIAASHTEARTTNMPLFQV
jgi:hypothetical protein